MRKQTVLSQPPAGNGSMKSVTVGLLLPPTPMLSHRDSTTLPGSPPWQQKVEMQQQQRASCAGSPLAAAGRVFGPDRPAPRSLSPVVVKLPADCEKPAATSNGSSSPSPPRTPSRILSASRGIHRRQPPPTGFDDQHEGIVSPPLLDDRFKLQPLKQKSDLGEADLSPAAISYIPVHSSLTVAGPAAGALLVVMNLLNARSFGAVHQGSTGSLVISHLPPVELRLARAALLTGK
jgi:hypothetical protein